MLRQDYDQQEEQRYQQQQLQDIFDGDIDVNDPHLAAVFPDFAASFAQDEERATDEEMYDSLDFVDHSDFAVLNRDGHVEDYGGWEKLEETVKATHQPDPDQPAGNGGPTTLMLFNIFTPDEVDFLSALVGEDAVQELKDDVDNDKVAQVLLITISDWLFISCSVILSL